MAVRFDKILVANRGEIARRVLRTLREMGIASVAVYSDADENAPHVHEADEAVRIGPPPSRDSYLDMAAVIAAANKVGAQAIHPGYGFLAENAVFAEKCAEAGLTFIGPPVDAIRRMGSKIGAKAIMVEAGVPTIPGFTAAGLSDDLIAAEAVKLGLPVLIKASAGGGGKGMRIVREAGAFTESLAAARREAESSFGDDTLLLERYFDSPRHVEVQIFGDGHGNVIHCFERECSIQRRFQKVIEEAPSPAVDEALRVRMGDAAVAAGKAIGYVGAGTVEFLLDSAGQFYFLEVNTRLQVEHPVTEMVTGLDLVRMQIAAAQGEALAVTQQDLRLTGHAFEARLYAEDASKDFLPATGRVCLWEPAVLPGLRYDSGVETGTEVSVHYDPLLAKIVACGATRDEALDRMISALRRLAVAGLVTNRDFLVSVLAHPAFRAGQLDTHFIDRHLPAASRQANVDTATLHLHAVVAALYDHERRRGAGGPLPASIPSGWRNNRWRAQDEQFHAGETLLRVNYIAREPGAFDVQVEGATDMTRALVSDYDGAGLVVELGGVRRRFRVATNGDHVFVHGPAGTTELVRVPRFHLSHAEELAGGCVAPMTGIIRKVNVAVGDQVNEGDVLLVLEAMKMEHQLVTHAHGIVREVRVEVGQMVDPDDVLVIVEGDEED
ncbi:MAG: ATP-grasp domain-containing protein [Deltaproteobacteria bacterium]|nr:ATP-grasp domain-containing protein [Deltaproteobacteria bacterium]